MDQPINVLFLAAEADPFIRIGGLGEVASALPLALKKIGDINIRLVLPLHGIIQRQGLDLKLEATFDVPSARGNIKTQALSTNYNGLPIYFITGAYILPDAPVYSSDTYRDGLKYTYFSLAALYLAKTLGWQVDILHANDWHTAAAIYALKKQLVPGNWETTTILSIHNLPYLGNKAGPALSAFNLPPSNDPALPAWARHLPLPLGLLTTDQIVAVSPSYAREIQSAEFGSGLHTFLRTQSRKISGILNGLNTRQWDPASDRYLVQNYTPECMTSRLENKIALQKEFNLQSDPRIPLLGLVSRMDPQKGIDLLPNALRLIQKQKWQVIILGTGVPEIEAAARQLSREYPQRVRSAIRFDAVLSHRIYAGSDAFLIPSRYEPCGLTQMISMRYGCIPIARSTGGLRDTITDYRHGNGRTGFLFSKATPHALAAAIRRALKIYSHPIEWKEMQLNGMLQDFSWENSARKYIQLYQQLVAEI